MKTVKNDPFASKIERDTLTSTVNAEPNEPKQSPKAQKVEKNDNSLKLMAKLFATIKAECINDKIKSHLITVHALLCKIYRRKEHLKALKSKKEGNLPVENNLTNINIASNVSPHSNLSAISFANLCPSIFLR